MAEWARPAHRSLLLWPSVVLVMILTTNPLTIWKFLQDVRVFVNQPNQNRYARKRGDNKLLLLRRRRRQQRAVCAYICEHAPHLLYRKSKYVSHDDDQQTITSLTNTIAITALHSADDRVASGCTKAASLYTLYVLESSAAAHARSHLHLHALGRCAHTHTLCVDARALLCAVFFSLLKLMSL